ncbi:MAG: hypothetical protein U0835_06210 [Isosphaeraceae bacterium]
MQEEEQVDWPEMWAGVECTVNRVGDTYFDQLRRSGHDLRHNDVDLIAGLSVRAVRYPVLWERHQPPADWSWADHRLSRLREHGVRPVVGLVHHGSGPWNAPLYEEAFAEGLAGFAADVARRFPWVDAYTPVNEPLTTARFCGLYGHWYPHGRDDPTFVRCLLNQCRAVVLSMRAVREVRPEALLVQTDDLGQTHAPRPLRYQADFENERRWLSWDLLCGRVDRGHPLYGYLSDSGACEDELGWFLDNPCPPDVIGINHYVTSERYLDDRTDLYPAHLRGGNARKAYVDTEAVRVLRQGGAGLQTLLQAAWDRYGIPLAVTEAHLGCTEDEQVRWLWDVWKSVLAARAGGADVRAVTAWAVFGTFDWNSLVTREAGCYEPGAFDVRDDPPRPTPIAGLIRDLAARRTPDLPALAEPGWWRRPERFLFPAPSRPRRPSRRAVPS